MDGDEDPPSEAPQKWATNCEEYFSW
jgi:hypothetical protein